MEVKDAYTTQVLRFWAISKLLSALKHSFPVRDFFPKGKLYVISITPSDWLRYSASLWDNTDLWTFARDQKLRAGGDMAKSKQIFHKSQYSWLLLKRQHEKRKVLSSQRSKPVIGWNFAPLFITVPTRSKQKSFFFLQRAFRVVK